MQRPLDYDERIVRLCSLATASESVAKIVNLHSVTAERQARDGNPLSRLQPSKDLDLSALDGAYFHRPRLHGLIRPDHPRYLLSSLQQRDSRDRHKDSVERRIGRPVLHIDR